MIELIKKIFFSPKQEEYVYFALYPEVSISKPEKIEYKRIKIRPMWSLDAMALESVGFEQISKQKWDGRHKRVYR